nr:mobile mystery protein B [Pinirhizobacter soli]
MFDFDEGQTPLTDEERRGLKPAFITFRHELNAAEQANILAASVTLRKRAQRLGAADLADEAFICNAHKAMYADVWRWAGSYRTTDRNIGVEAHVIRVQMRLFTDDARLWINEGVFPPDELAVRFHHRLVAIHPFPNGNGRLSRMMGDLLVESLGRGKFTWGANSLTEPGATRSAYIRALQAADRHDITSLLQFARS